MMCMQISHSKRKRGFFVCFNRDIKTLKVNPAPLVATRQMPCKLRFCIRRTLTHFWSQLTSNVTESVVSVFDFVSRRCKNRQTPFLHYLSEGSQKLFFSAFAVHTATAETDFISDDDNRVKPIFRVNHASRFFAVLTALATILSFSLSQTCLSSFKIASVSSEYVPEIELSGKAENSGR